MAREYGFLMIKYNKPEFIQELQNMIPYKELYNEDDNDDYGVENKYNVFRKDEVKNFEDKEALMANAPEKERNMFKIPKVIQ